MRNSPLIAIIVISLGLRLWGSAFGLPYSYHVDESQYVSQAARMMADGTLRPSWFNNPPFAKYVLVVEYSALYVVGRVVGEFDSAAEFARVLEADGSILYLLGRWSSAIVSSVTVVVVYLLTKRMSGRAAGLVAALLYAVAFHPVRDAHFATNDSWLVLFTALGLHRSLVMVDCVRSRDLVIGGILVGLAFATKYSGLVVALPLVAVYGMNWHRNEWSAVRALRDLARFALAGVVSALAVSPYFVLSPGIVLADVLEALYAPGRSGFEGWMLDPAGGYVYYLRSLVIGMGWPLFLISVCALVVVLARKSNAGLLAALVPLVVYLFLGRQEMYFARFMLPCYPGLIALAGTLIAGFGDAKRVGNLSRWRLVLAVLVVIPTLRDSIRFDVLISREDTRTAAKVWIEGNIPAKARIVMDRAILSPPLSTPLDRQPRSSKLYDVILAGDKGVSMRSIDYYRRLGVEYIVSSSFIEDIGLSDPVLHAERKGFYKELSRDGELSALFKPYRASHAPEFVFDQIYGPWSSLSEFDRPGPEIRIYRIAE